jgi:hypothetical protein
MIIVSHTAPTTGFEKGLSKGKKELGPIPYLFRKKKAEGPQYRSVCMSMDLLPSRPGGRGQKHLQMSGVKREKG